MHSVMQVASNTRRGTRLRLMKKTFKTDNFIGRQCTILTYQNRRWKRAFGNCKHSIFFLNLHFQSRSDRSFIFTIFFQGDMKVDGISHRYRQQKTAGYWLLLKALLVRLFISLLYLTSYEIPLLLQRGSLPVS